MFFFDGHCDTITTAMKKNENLFKISCHIDIERMCKFDNPVQVFSVWLEKEKLLAKNRTEIEAKVAQSANAWREARLAEYRLRKAGQL